MSRESVISISADKLLALADRLRNLELDLRKLGLNGFTGQPTSHTPTQSDKIKPIVLELDISQITFMQKKLGDGSNEIATSYSQWGWTKGYTHETAELTQNLERYGSVQIGNRIFTLSGDKGTLINFKRT